MLQNGTTRTRKFILLIKDMEMQLNRRRCKPVVLSGVRCRTPRFESGPGQIEAGVRSVRRLRTACSFNTYDHPRAQLRSAQSLSHRLFVRLSPHYSIPAGAPPRPKVSRNPTASPPLCNGPFLCCVDLRKHIILGNADGGHSQQVARGNETVARGNETAHRSA